MKNKISPRVKNWSKKPFRNEGNLRCSALSHLRLGTQGNVVQCLILSHMRLGTQGNAVQCLILSHLRLGTQGNVVRCLALSHLTLGTQGNVVQRLALSHLRLGTQSNVVFFFSPLCQRPRRAKRVDLASPLNPIPPEIRSPRGITLGT